MKAIKVGVVNNRHDLPVQDYVFDEIDDVTNVLRLEQISHKSLSRIAEKNGLVYKTIQVYGSYGIDNMRTMFEGRLELYVTGLTVAVTSALKVACNFFPIVVLWFYDKEKEVYYSQTIQNILF